MVVVQPNHVSTEFAIPIVLAGATSMAVGMPSGYLADDVLMATFTTINLEANGGAPSAPPGGWLMVADNTFGDQNLRCFYKYATGAEGAAEDFPLPPHPEGADRTGEYTVTVVAYRDAADYPDNVAINNSGGAYVASWTAPTYSAVVPSRVVSMWPGGGGPLGLSKDVGSTNRSSNLTTNYPFVLDRLSGPGTTSGTTLTRVSGDPGYNFQAGAITVGLRPANSAPFAPPLVSMASGEVIAVGQVNRAYHAFSDPDEDLDRPEGQSGFDIRYREIGAPAWTTIAQPANANQYYDFAPGTFISGLNYERQVRTYDLAGEVGPYSASGFFTGGTAPAAPAIDSPTVNQQMDAIEVLAWTVVTQLAYQYRRVADNNGVPDVTQVYWASAAVPDSGARTAPLTFPNNNRFEHVQLRVWDGVLWSDWSSVRVEVAYTGPPAPLITLVPDPDDGSLRIEYDTPAPVGEQPTPTRVDIWIDDGEDIPNERKATGLPVDGVWTHWTPRSDRDYRPHVHATSYSADGIPSATVTTLTFFLDSPTRGVLDQNTLA